MASFSIPGLSSGSLLPHGNVFRSVGKAAEVVPVVVDVFHWWRDVIASLVILGNTLNILRSSPTLLDLSVPFSTAMSNCTSVHLEFRQPFKLVFQ